MKAYLKPILVFLLAVGSLGAIVQLTGIIPIKASSGHWSITSWFLNFSMSRSVSTHAIPIETPFLKDEGMILRGAGHYEIGCRQCHGGVESTSLLGRKLTPKAPFLPPKISEWEPKELFYIVKHGVKFTGMPAWPDQKRDDEVWAMVAFLLKMPELSEDEYQKLVYGDKSPLLIRPSPYSGLVAGHILRTCSNCHGVDGNGRGEGAFPKLAGQNAHYLEHALIAFKKGERHSGTMELMASPLEEETIKDIALYYSRQKMSPTTLELGLTPEEKAKAIARGEIIAKNGIPAQRVAACIGCHGPAQGRITKKPYFPDLRNQPAPYLANQLRLFVNDKRGGSDHAELMKKAVPEMSETQMKDVSLYYQSLLQSAENHHPPDVQSKNKK